MMIHVVNNFVSSTVHASLIAVLSKTVKDQLVIIPIRDHNHKGLNSDGLGDVQFKYILFNNRVIKYFPLFKVFLVSVRCYFSLRSAKKASEIDGEKLKVIAHNFWSDGMVAFFNSFFIPMRYMMVVRNTDINYFVARLPHYRWLMGWAIKRSAGLSFVSKSHYLRFKARWPSLLSCARKVEIIPNAVSDWWLDNLLMEPLARGKQACFVGRFDANKNLKNLVLAAQLVYDAMPEFRLVLVGGSEEEFCAATGCRAVPGFVVVCGRLPKEELLKVYRRSRLFVMPSFTETFGLVYLEALSQGCAVICSSGEGIDGMWEVPFIRSVEPESVDDIARTIVELVAAFPEGIPVSWSTAQVGKFSWTQTADEYLEFFS
jgi:glycosyltransferase involved in cell wall biosynthesis|tara:strand:- start:9572 stop:10690 length:1119 start_codon:yes stop_codon:yes gene_type:complete